MFGRKRNNPSKISVEDVEHVLGVSLSQRSNILNYGEISKPNIFAGTVIGRAFVEDKLKLSDECDFIVMFFAKSVLAEKGIEPDVIEAAQKAMFNNLGEPESGTAEDYQKRYNQRIADYEAAADMEDVALRWLKNIAVRPLNNREVEACKLLAKQLTDIKKYMTRGIEAELKASR